ncbi:signal recognition particle-docking protein FtsY [Haloterrigena alkaliphila]|uniref:Signal recognition particle receptor FtsY n=1 Tax=Haloterrigena alkaliphila TaxID=2816475 RepID=A0A8A2VS02_9EURY|nr:signal recognition particle-docking protein FtsY [Haloterrigena alkaliphila]QSX00819.1 signal recognition particle-docking protein FtsY [Haloterrigena alkaliphila]
MFDNLKDKLGSFRKDAEEAAEENVEDVDEDDLEAAELEDAEAADADGAADASEAAAPTDAEAEVTTDDATAEPDAPDTTGEPVDDGVDEPASDREAETAATETPEPTETAEVSAEAEADAGTEPASSPAGVEAETSSTDEPSAAEPATEPESDPEAESEAESGLDLKGMIERGSEADESTDTADTDEPAGPVETDEPADAEAAETADAAAAEDDADESSTGFGAKARSLVKGKFVIEEEDLEGPLHELEMALLSSDVEMGVAEEILDNIRDELVGETRTFTTSTGEVVEEALRDAIYDVISVGQFDFDERVADADKPVTIVFTGVNGVGKTTSIAKLSRYFERQGYSTVMANGDTYRAGANEQIQEHADALGTKCISHEQGGDPAAVLYDAVEYAEANDIDVVLGDTAGRLHTNEGLMDQLEKIDRVVGPDMTLFVDEAVAGQDAVNRAREFDEAAEIDGAILTKADADSNGGAAISVAHVTGKPILFLGVGQGYDDIERFDPDEMLDRLLEEE